MGILNKIIIGLGIILAIIIVIGIILPNINGNGKTITNSTANQNAFVTNEIKAITNSNLPFQINPANTLVFGSWKNTSQRICGQQQAYFEILNPSQLNVLYNGYYVPIYQIIKAYGNYNPNLISQKVYLNFITNNNKNISAPYIVKSEAIKNNEEYWNFTFDGSTSNAINSMLNTSTGNLTISWLNGVILLNGTPIISPVNPDINFNAPNC